MTFSKCPTQRRTTNAAENLVQFSAALASVASNPTTALTVRLLFDRGIVSISARFRAPRPFAHACERASIPVRTRYEPGWAPLRPAPPLSRFRVTGRVRTTRAPSVRVVVTRAVLCMTKYRTFGSSWFRLRPKHDPPFSLRDLPGSRRQVRADARRSLSQSSETRPCVSALSAQTALAVLPMFSSYDIVR